MQIEGVRFRKGVTYKIKNRKTQHYLAIKMNEIDSSITREEENIWIIEEPQKGQFQIIDMKSAKPITFNEVNHSIKLEITKSKDSHWIIQQAEKTKQFQYFWIKPLRNKGMSLRGTSLNSKIKVDLLDQTLNVSLWQFIQHDLKGQQYKGFSLIQSLASKLVLEVPQNSLKQGTPIIQANYRGYGNQRWIIYKSETQQNEQRPYFVRNFCTGLILTVQFSKFQNKVTQQLFSDSINQKWHLQQIDSKVFLIQPVSNKLFYLAVSSQKQGNHAILTHQGHRTSWIIQGYDPLNDI